MKVVCAGGGTLGSVTPLLAVLDTLRRRKINLKVDWFGTKTGPERILVETSGIKFHAISSGKLRRYLSPWNFIDVFKIILGFFQAWWWFLNNRSDILITAGSFVGVPVGWAAFFARVPVLIHQQDIRPSLANKLLAPIAKNITVTFQVSLKDFPRHKTLLAGNPVREAFIVSPNQPQAKIKLGLKPDVPVLAVLGGGTGAAFLNNLIAQAWPQIKNLTQVVLITGQGKLGNLKSSPGYLVLPFTTDTPTVLAAADLVMARAGMGVLTELAAFSKAAIVVPIPQSHQEDNAEYFRQTGAIKLINQANLTCDVFVATVIQLLANFEERTMLGEKLHAVFPAQAATTLADKIIKIVGNK